MGDQQKWFKFWCSAPSDDDLQALPPATRWAWAAFGAYTKEHGTKGKIIVRPSNASLAAQMGVTLESLSETIKVLPHIDVEEGENRNGELTVTWHNWNKYQGDSTVADRQKRWRDKNRNGLRGEEIRGDKKRGDKSNSPKGSQADRLEFLVDRVWGIWPKHKRMNKGDLRKALKTRRPDPELFEKILAKIELLKQSSKWTKDGGQFIPYPASWINAEGWEDEVSDFLGVRKDRMPT